MKFKFKIGQFVHYVNHPELKFFVVERHRQECYSALQNSYMVRSILSGRDATLKQVSRDLIRVLEVEVVAD